jgi:hypothetical protein
MDSLLAWPMGTAAKAASVRAAYGEGAAAQPTSSAARTARYAENFGLMQYILAIKLAMDAQSGYTFASGYPAGVLLT